MTIRVKEINHKHTYTESFNTLIQCLLCTKRNLDTTATVVKFKFWGETAGCINKNK